MSSKVFPAGYCVSDVMKRPGFFVVLTLNDVTNQNVNIIFVTCDDVTFYVVCRSYTLLLSYCVCVNLCQCKALKYNIDIIIYHYLLRTIESRLLKFGQSH